MAPLLLAVNRDAASLGAGSVQPPCMQFYNFKPCHFTFRLRTKMTRFLLDLLFKNSTSSAMTKGALISMVAKTIKSLILILTTTQVYLSKMKTVLKNQQFCSVHK